MTTDNMIKIPYQPPVILTFSGEELIEEITFAQGCSPSPCPVP
jgi:hypothetical protein